MVLQQSTKFRADKSYQAKTLPELLFTEKESMYMPVEADSSMVTGLHKNYVQNLISMYEKLRKQQLKLQQAKRGKENSLVHLFAPPQLMLAQENRLSVEVTEASNKVIMGACSIKINSIGAICTKKQLDATSRNQEQTLQSAFSFQVSIKTSTTKLSGSLKQPTIE